MSLSLSSRETLKYCDPIRSVSLEMEKILEWRKFWNGDTDLELSEFRGVD